MRHRFLESLAQAQLEKLACARNGFDYDPRTGMYIHYFN
jgi:hypothetical protein